ncbi:MAG: peptide deformylase [Deltaproteobacteria bacterium]|nr:peptide deformylase [Deltaproteobacteria bacterium]
MALREIVIWPDPVLTREAEAVDPSEFGEDFDALLEDMIETMYDADGLGLAAPQIGISKQIFVVDVPQVPLDDYEGEGEEELEEEPEGEGAPRTGPLVFVNPEFVEMEGEVTFEEGCLSLPDLTVEMKRAARVKVRALDAHGEPFEVDAEGLYAIALQHEHDHLTGNLLVERISPLKRKLYKKKMLKLKAEQDEE